MLIEKINPAWRPQHREIEMVASKTRFNSKEHITAGQLRRMGFYVHENIRDSAFVRRTAVGLDDAERLNRRSATVKLKVLEPFEITIGTY
jgi:hypothetical protein